MLRFKTALITAITFILPSVLLSVETAQGKDNPVPKIKFRVEITGISGDGLGGSIDAFGSDQQDQLYFTTLLTDVVIVSFRTRVADQRDPQSLQVAALEDVGLKANATQFFYLQSDGTLLNTSNISPDALSSR